MKKLIASVLALVCVLGLAGCNTQETPQDATKNSMSKEEKLMEATKVYVETVLQLTDTSCVLGNQLSVYKLGTGKLERIDYEKYPVFAGDKVCL